MIEIKQEMVALILNNNLKKSYIIGMEIGFVQKNIMILIKILLI